MPTRLHGARRTVVIPDGGSRRAGVHPARLHGTGGVGVVVRLAVAELTGLHNAISSHVIPCSADDNPLASDHCAGSIVVIPIGGIIANDLVPARHHGSVIGKEVLLAVNVLSANYHDSRHRVEIIPG